MTKQSPTKEDLQFIERQLGRKARGVFEISARCKSGHPLVVKTKPVLKRRKVREERSVEIFPTLYYLVCGSVISTVSWLESEGLLAELQEKVNTNTNFRAALLKAQEEHRNERNALVDVPLNESQKEALNTGIGGVKQLDRIKCLHCHLAHYLATGDNPVGQTVYNQSKIRPNSPLEKGRTAYNFPLCKRGIKGDLPVKASIDIGTNSTRLLVAEVTDALTKDLHREARVTRLGQDVNKTKRLAPEAVERTIDVLLDYLKTAKRLGASDIVIAATSAARDAKNIASFINTVKAKTGFQVKVLGPDQEASLSFKGAVQSFFPFSLGLRTTDYGLRPCLVLDIGGGSTELILGTEIATRPSAARNDVIARNRSPRPSGSGQAPQSPIKLAFSKDIGSVRLTEMFIKNDPPLENEIEKASEYIKQVYSEPVAQILQSSPDFQMIGTAGTVTTLAALNLQLGSYDVEKVHCSTLSLSSVESLLGKLKKLTIIQRKELKTMQPGRADVIVVGALILLTLMKMLKAQSLLVSEKDILDGLLVNKS